MGRFSALRRTDLPINIVFHQASPSLNQLGVVLVVLCITSFNGQLVLCCVGIRSHETRLQFRRGGSSSSEFCDTESNGGTKKFERNSKRRGARHQEKCQRILSFTWIICDPKQLVMVK